MGDITLTNISGQDLILDLPDGAQEVFKDGQTKTGSATGTYSVNTGSTNVASLDYQSGSVSLTITSANL
jgi:hypothetical protein